jgi:cell division septum initiation protein DivIVA
MPLDPNEIDPSKLPHTAFGGFKPDETVELLRRVGWEYREILDENAKLAANADELRRNADQLAAEVETLRSGIAALKEEKAARTNRDEAARVAITAALRAASELRESTRRDCEVVLKKVHRRAESIRAEIERLDLTAAQAELGRLKGLQAEVREQLQDSLLSVLALVEDQAKSAPALVDHALDQQLLGLVGDTSASTSAE